MLKSGVNVGLSSIPVDGSIMPELSRTYTLNFQKKP